MYDFTINKSDKTITIKREFAAKRDVVWDAYTKSEILDQWWAPKPWQARTKSLEFKTGGKWIYAMVGPAGEEHWSVAQYKEVNPKSTFSSTDAFSDSNGTINNDMPRSEWTVSFTDKGMNTLVQIFIQFDDLAQLEGMINMGFKEGLAMAMENLDALLK